MEGFPFTWTSIPVETRRFDVHLEVFGHLFENFVERRTLFLPVQLVVGDHVRVVVPQSPEFFLKECVRFRELELFTLIDARTLDLVEKIIVDRHVVFISKKAIYDNNIATNLK